MSLRITLNKILMISVLLTPICSSLSTNSDYCNIETCKPLREHTMCKYKSAVALACDKNYEVGLTETLKKYIVDRHNELRRKVASGQEAKGNPGPQPAAVTMPDLTWDDELATIAQRWANQCDFKPDKCRNVDRFVAGQNLAQTMASNDINVEASVERCVNMWYDGVKDFDKSQVSSFQHDPKTKAGSYTQLVWAKTKRIGCGYIKYRDESKWSTGYLVCNYGPSGNWIGEKIYEVEQRY